MGDWRDLAEAFRKRSRDLDEAWLEGTTNATDILLEASKQRMNREIYSIPEDVKTKRRVKGKPSGGRKFRWQHIKAVGLRGGVGAQKKWRRTGTLRRSERTQIISPFAGIVENTAKAKRGSGGYSHARHNLGLRPGDRRVIPPAPSKRRRTFRQAPWRAEAIEDTKDTRLEAYRKPLFAVLKQTAVR